MSKHRIKYPYNWAANTVTLLGSYTVGPGRTVAGRGCYPDTLHLSAGNFNLVEERRFRGANLGDTSQLESAKRRGQFWEEGKACTQVSGCTGE